MKSIETRYYGPTNTKGARISATDCGDHKIYISYPYKLSGEDCHRKAAVALCDKLGWKDADKLIGGETKDGYVFVFPPANPAERLLAIAHNYGTDSDEWRNALPEVRAALGE